MKRTSFFFRLFLGNMLLVAIIIALGGSVSYHYLNENYQQKTEQHQWDMLFLARDSLQRDWPVSLEDLRAHSRAFNPDSDYRLTLIDTDGRVLGDSQANVVDMENHKTADRPEVLAAINGQVGRDVDRRSDTLDIRFRYLAAPIKHNGQVVAVARLAMPIRAIDEEGTFIRGALYWGAIATLLAAIVLGLLVSWLWYRPLKLITLSARRIASGDLTQRPHVRGSAELVELSAALNEMRLTVSSQLDLITTQRENLQTILANLEDGVIAVDRDGQIVFINAAAQALLAPDVTHPVGQQFQSVVRIAEGVDVYNDIIAGKANLDRQLDVELRGRRYSLHVQASRITQSDTSNIWMLLVVRDITDTARTASMKAEFVANASHELRTPLATLRATVDSLNEDDADRCPETMNKFIDMLDRNVARLENMTNDLLDLHTVESSRAKVLGDEVQLGALILRASGQFLPRAREKNIKLTVHSRDEDHLLHTDRKLIEMILQNLLDNAIKFTPEGGHVECDISPDNGQVMIRVQDSGRGISPEDQTKVFDRFFQAEASRTGDNRVRGTGLGLAIVRHASERLGATIDLRSSLGQGTTVTIHIPVDPSGSTARGV